MTQKRLPLILLWLVLLSARIFAASDAQQRILVEDGLRSQVESDTETKAREMKNKIVRALKNPNTSEKQLDDLYKECRTSLENDCFGIGPVKKTDIQAQVTFLKLNKEKKRSVKVTKEVTLEDLRASPQRHRNIHGAGGISSAAEKAYEEAADGISRRNRGQEKDGKHGPSYH